MAHLVLPEKAARPSLVVCERTGRWAVAIGRAWPEAEPVVETRSLAECWERLAEAPSSFLVVELSEANLDPLLERIARLARDYPVARLAVVASTEWGSHEWLLREAGAVHFVTASRGVGPLVDLARRHLARAPRPPEDLTRHWQRRLPWSRHATVR